MGARAGTATSADNGLRFRVFVKGVFACVIRAADEDEARDAAIAALEVRAQDFGSAASRAAGRCGLAAALFVLGSMALSALPYLTLGPQP